MPPMRIVHYLYSTKPEVGGPARATIDLCAALALQGHDVGLICAEASGVPPAWTQTRAEGRPWMVHVPARYYPGKTLPRDASRRIGELIDGAAVVHLHGVWDVCNVQVAAEARRRGIPYIVSVRGMLDDWCMGQKALKKRLFLSLAVRRWLEGAAFVHLTAEAEHEQARKHFPRGRGVVIPNLLDLRPFEALPGPEVARAKFPMLGPSGGGRPNLLFLSRVHVKKGLETLLRAGALLRKRGIDANILIAGRGEAGYVESVKRLASDLGLADRAFFLEQVVDTEKLSLYQAADLFVLPTSQENFGFVFVEALACGTPVVTTKGVDIWPELESSGGALIADATPEATADAVARLLAERNALADMGRKGREWVFRDLAPAKVLKQFEVMYARAIEGSPKGAGGRF